MASWLPREQPPVSPPRIAGGSYRWQGWRGGRRSRSAWHSPAGAGTSRAGGHPGRPGPARCTALGGVQGGGVRLGRAQGHPPGVPCPTHLACHRRWERAGLGRGTAPRTAPSAACWPGTPAAPACTAGRQRDVSQRGDTARCPPPRGELPPSLPPSCKCGRQSRRQRRAGRHGRACSPRGPWRPAA